MPLLRPVIVPCCEPLSLLPAADIHTTGRHLIFLPLYATGAVYVFVTYDNGQTWVQEAKLLASDGGAGDEFGHSVAVHNHIIVAGAYGDDDKGNAAGEGHRCMSCASIASF